jgi:acetylornithine deacetylase/succinyl-diaminopimelate desuccinylase-like protein
VIPYTTPGYSDNRFLREEGKQVYGFFPLLPEDSLAGIHGFNESISIESLTNAYKLLKDIVREFAVS